MSKAQESIIFVDEGDTPLNVKISYKELTTKPLPPFWRNFISKHFLDPRRKNKRYTFERDRIKKPEQFTLFFKKIMDDKTHIITECLDTYKKHFETAYLSQTKTMKQAISNVREFVTCFSLHLAKEWGVKLSFYSIVYRHLAINLINTLYPLLIGLYICRPRNQELSVILHKLEGSNLALSELGVPKELHMDYSSAWRILKKVTKSQDITSLSSVVNYFYYQLFLCIDEKHKKKIKVKDVDLSKIILFCIAKAQISQQNVHCIINLIFDFSHGLISEKDFSVVNLLHSIFTWIKSSVKVERDADFKRYHKRTIVKGRVMGNTSGVSGGPNNVKGKVYGSIREQKKIEHQKKIQQARDKKKLQRTKTTIPKGVHEQEPNNEGPKSLGNKVKFSDSVKNRSSQLLQKKSKYGGGGQSGRGPSNLRTKNFNRKPPIFKGPNTGTKDYSARFQKPQPPSVSKKN